MTPSAMNTLPVAPAKCVAAGLASRPKFPSITLEATVIARPIRNRGMATMRTSIKQSVECAGEGFCATSQYVPPHGLHQHQHQREAQIHSCARKAVQRNKAPDIQ